MVVDDVEDHRQPARVGRSHQPAQAIGAAVGARRREQADAVVAPAAIAGEVGDRHQLDRRHAQGAQVVQPLDQRVERPRVRRRADMQLVDDQVLQRDAAPARVRPREHRRVDDLRGAVDAVGLEARRRVGARVAAVQPVHIARARPEPREVAGEVARAFGSEREGAGLAPLLVQHDLDVPGIGGPDAEAHALVVGLRADRESPGGFVHVYHYLKGRG